MMNHLKNLFFTMKQWDYKNQNKKYIDQREFLNHFKEFPFFCKFMWFCLERNSDGCTYYEYKNICYKDFLDLCSENPDNDNSLFMGFNYGKKALKTVVFMENENE